MTSSTKPPNNARKFQFGLDFDVEQERTQVAVSPTDNMLETEMTPYAPELQFSEQDLKDAHAEGFKEGHHHGMTEAATANDTVAGEALHQIYAALEALLENETRRIKTAQEIALRTTVASLKKIWPQIVQQQGLKLIETTIRQSMESNPEETRIVVRVHDTMLDPVVDRLPQIQSQQAFAGKVIILADPGVQLGDCKVEWADGGLERLSRTLSAQIDHALERILTNLSQHTQSVEPEGTAS